MLIKDEKIYRNLQEQVLKNQDDIKDLINRAKISDLGIKIVTADPYPSADDLPLPYDGAYGDGFLVGTEFPYELYIWTRENNEYNGEWFDFGPLNAPSVVPGPPGDIGPAGPQGERGSLWSSQSGEPAQYVGVNNGDQAMDTNTGNIYQFSNGVWNYTGNIRGPRGIQGIEGPEGPQGLQGETGPMGPQGPQGDAFTIAGSLDNTGQLPSPTSVPRSYAYLIPDASGAEHLWVIIGTDDASLIWHDAGAFGGGSTINISGNRMSEVDMTNVINGAASYKGNGNTQTSASTTSVTFSNLRASGQNLEGQNVDTVATISLPIAASDDIIFKAENGTVKATISESYKDTIQEQIDAVTAKSITITAASTSTSGTLTAEQLSDLQADSGTVIVWNNEIYRSEDITSSPLKYIHVHYDSSGSGTVTTKTLSINTSNRQWTLNTNAIADANTLKSYLALAGGTMTGPIYVGESDGQGINFYNSFYLDQIAGSGSTNQNTVFGYWDASIKIGRKSPTHIPIIMRGEVEFQNGAKFTSGVPTIDGTAMGATYGYQRTSDLSSTDSGNNNVQLLKALYKDNVVFSSLSAETRGYLHFKVDGQAVAALSSNQFNIGIDGLYWKDKPLSTAQFSLSGTTLTITDNKFN